MNTINKQSKGGWGKKLLLGISVATIVGGYLADLNRTHILNPRWTPHSKFHNALSVITETFLGSAGLYFLLRKRGNKKDNLKFGTLAPGFFWASMLGAIAFPGAKPLEAEFPEKVPEVGKVRLNETFASIVMLSLLGLGYFKERKRLQP
ncbi:DUF6640 family protein [Olivibacter sp. XZL3]|uniref:DUF6640 family protein n=1 Tax=Olivibacter sp. XZL3 TaxID=1735116 RepID=UPI00106620D5|nr:DUF6640 family protein [Olivibacter sp. XZL3]